MVLHKMVWNGNTSTAEKFDFTAEEESAQLETWAKEEQKAKNAVPIATLEQRIKVLEIKLGIV